MFAALSKTLGQMGDPAFRGVMLRALGLSIVAYVLVWILAWFGLDWFGPALEARLPDWLDWMVDAVFWVSILIASFLLFPAVVTVAMGIFLEDIAAAVEHKHYPGLPAPRQPPLGEVIGDALKFAIVTVVVNLLALPLYLLLLFVPPFNLLLFYGINGYLLGREYFELVAVRRLDSPETRRLRRRYRGRTFLAGVVITFLFSIPLVNLLAPIVATGLSVHVFEKLRRDGGGAVSGAT